MNKLFINIRYLLAPLAIATTTVGVFTGGSASWIGVGLLGLAIVADTLIKTQTKGAGFDQQTV